MEIFRHVFDSFSIRASVEARSISVLKREWVFGHPIEKTFQSIRVGFAKSKATDFETLFQHVKLVRNENFSGRISQVVWDQDEATIMFDMFIEIPLGLRLPRTFLRKLEKHNIITCDWEEDWLVEEQQNLSVIRSDFLQQVDESKLSVRLANFQKEGVAWMIGKEQRHNSMNPFQHIVPWSKPPTAEIYITFINKTDIVFRTLVEIQRRGGFLCDSTGMGKTVQMVALMNLNGFHFRDPTQPFFYPHVRNGIGKRKRFYVGVQKVECGYEAMCKGKSLGVYETPEQASCIRDEAILRYQWDERVDGHCLEPAEFLDDVVEGGTLVIADVSLNMYWKQQIQDKSNPDYLPNIFVWTQEKKEYDPSVLSQYDVVIVSPGMIRSESRKAMEHVKSEFADQEWECESFSKQINFEKPKTSWDELEPMDIVYVSTWGFSFAFTHIDNGHAFGYEYPIDNLYLTPIIDIGEEFEWYSASRVERCNHVNPPLSGERYKLQTCESCKTPRIKPSCEEEMFNMLRRKHFSIFEKIFWRRMIIDESSKIVSHSNSQTFQDISNLVSLTLWCVTANPDNGGTYGQEWMTQLSLFGITKNFIRQTRSDAFHDELIYTWTMQRHKEHFTEELALPSVKVHVERFDMSEGVRETYTKSLAHAQRACLRVKKPFSINILIAFQKLLFMCSAQTDINLFRIENDMILKTVKLSEADKIVGGQTEHCPICHDYPIDPVCTDCSHVFCLGCLQPWILKKPSCPLCKSKIKPSNIRKLILDELDRDDSRERIPNTAKLEWIKAYLESIPTDEKIVLATQYGPVSQILYEYFESDACFIHSKLGRSERFEEMMRFEKDESKRIMVVTIKTAGVGIDLTRANHLIIVDVLYRQNIANQLIGRLHRYGQTREIQVHHLLMRNTVEEKLYEFLQEYHWSAEYICNILQTSESCD